MAFLLKSSKFYYTVFGTASRIVTTGKKSCFLKHPNVARVNKLGTRFAASVGAKRNIQEKYNEREYESGSVEKLIYQLNRNMKYRNVPLSDVEKLLVAVKEQGEITSPQLLLLLKGCTQSSFLCTNKDRIKLAENIWNVAEKYGVTFSISHYNALLTVFLENHHKFNPEDFLEILEKKNLEADKVTFLLFLKAYGQQGNIEGAKQILIKMKELNIPLGEEEFNALIQGHCESGDFEKATKLLEVMKSRNIMPTSRTYMEFLLGYAKRGNFKELDEQLDKLAEEEILIGNVELLEIIYTLAVNNHETHIDSVMKRLSPGKDINLYTARIIQKLLLKKKDSLALEIFQHTISPDISKETVLLRAKFILQHFATYREPEETLNICKYMKEKGWTNCALNFVLRHVLLNKDEIACLKFLNSMRKEGLEVRSHYYWPIIIKASKKGSAYLRSVLRKLPPSTYKDSCDLMIRVIFPNYQFRTNWQLDFEFLVSLGINEKLLNFCLFEKKLREHDLEQAEAIISKGRVIISRWTHIINILVSALIQQPDKIESFLNILNCFGHDLTYAKRGGSDEQEFEAQSVEDDISADELEKVFDYAITSVVTHSKNEELIKDLLEGMLKRRMGISREAANSISLFKDDKITNLINKLADPEVKFELDINFLRGRVWKISEEDFSSVSDRAKDIVCTSKSAEELLEKAKSELDITDKIFVAITMVVNKQLTEASEIMNNLADKNTDVSEAPPAAQSLLCRFGLTVGTNFPQHLSTAYDWAVRLHLPEQKLLAIVNFAVNRMALRDAVRFFCDLKTKRDDNHDNLAFLKLLIRAARQRDNVSIEKLMGAYSEIFSKDVCNTYLAIALATSGKVEKAKELLALQKNPLKRRILSNSCNTIYKTGDIKALENCLKLAEGIPDFDRSILHKLLLRKCADKKDVESALKFCKVIEEDKTPDYLVLKEISAFRDDPTLVSLENLALSFTSKDSTNAEGNFSNFNQRMAAMDPSRHEVYVLMKKAASRGNFPEVLKLLERNKVRDLKGIGSSFLGNGNAKEFFDFLEHLAAKGMFKNIVHCFSLEGVPPLLKDDTYFQQYKTLAIRCLEEGYESTPLISLFVNCVKVPKRIPVAEEILQHYSAHFENIPFVEICEQVDDLLNESDFHKNFLTSEYIKNYFSNHLHEIYNKLIRFCSKNGDLDNALYYLKVAVSDKVEKSLDKSVIQSLDEALRKSGKTFPNPDLLSDS